MSYYKILQKHFVCVSRYVVLSRYVTEYQRFLKCEIETQLLSEKIHLSFEEMLEDTVFFLEHVSRDLDSRT
jgi:hypothetical protein